MKDNKIKKITLALGGLTALAAPLAAVVACGSAGGGSSSGGSGGSSGGGTGSGGSTRGDSNGGSTSGDSNSGDASGQNNPDGGSTTGGDTSGDTNHDGGTAAKTGNENGSGTGTGTGGTTNGGTTSGGTGVIPGGTGVISGGTTNGGTGVIPGGTSGTGTGTGTTTTPTQKFEYHGTQYDTMADAQAALDAELNQKSIHLWSLPGDKTHGYSTIEEALKAYIATLYLSSSLTNGDPSHIPADGDEDTTTSNFKPVDAYISKAYNYNGHAYKTEADAQTAWSAQPGNTGTPPKADASGSPITSVASSSDTVDHITNGVTSEIKVYTVYRYDNHGHPRTFKTVADRDAYIIQHNRNLPVRNVVTRMIYEWVHDTDHDNPTYYDTKADAYAALITTVSVTANKAELLYHI